MRLWMDSEKRTLTDEQLMRQIAHYGSLSSALEHGDVFLVSTGEDELASVSAKSHDASRRHLADYLERP